MTPKTKKIIPYFLILILLGLGLFAGAGKARANDCYANGQIIINSGASINNVNDCNNNGGQWLAAAPAAGTPGGANAPATGSCVNTTTGVITSYIQPCEPGSSWITTPAPATPAASGTTAPNNVLADNLKSCGAFGTSSFDGCIEQLFYYIFYGIPSFLLHMAAIFFNALIALTINSTLFTKSTFIPTAWAIVRDLSNIFFILILLYIAVQIILGIGHDAKKMIAKVVIIALLINFSMFFTEVIIDASNILALIFYNKIDTCTTMPGQSTPTCAPYVPASTSPEKNISGAMYSQFDVSQFLGQPFFDRLKQREQVVTLSNNSTTGVQGFIGQMIPIYGIYGVVSDINSYFFPSNDVPVPTMLALIFITGLIMLFAAYCFFIAGISFLGRLIELWILIIFSPFAMMSSTISILNDIEYIGWKAWFHRLLTVAFMAPIFMFFMYFIFLLIKSNIFTGLIVPDASQTITATILLTIIPAMILLILLLKATDFAKKGAGKLGEMLIKGTEIAMGAAAGLTLGGLAVAGQAAVGQLGSRLANTEWAKRREAEGRFGGAAFRKVTQGLATSSFDARKGIVGAGLAAVGSVSGLNLGHKTKYFMKGEGGFEADKKKKIEARQKRAKDLEVGEDEQLKQNVRQAETALDAAKSNPATQEALVRLNEGDRAAEATAGADLATANAALAPAQALATTLAESTYRLQEANNTLATREATLVAARTAAGTNLTDPALVAAEAARNTALADRNTAAANEATARTAAGANPVDPILVTARDAALAAQAAAQGLGPLERAAATGQRGLSDAERNLKDAIAQFGTNSAQANMARDAQVVALAERERTRINLENRQAAIRGAGADIHNAEVDLKRAQNAVIAENRTRRTSYADVVQNSFFANIDFLNAGGRWAGRGGAQREAANRIRADIQEAKK